MKNYNFQDCHEEKIHIPGHIQSFGYLVVFDFDSRIIKYASTNITDLFGTEAELLLGKKLADFPLIYDILYNAETSINFRIEQPRNKIYQPEILWINDKKYYYQLYSFNNLIYSEFEEVLDNSTNRNILLNLGNDILRVETEEELWQSLVDEINEIIEYDRVMIYKFLSDGSGKVIAENKNETYDSLLNVHYPESDIPRQARALYLKKRKRLIADVHSPVVPVIGLESEPLDMVLVSSRAVSPIHLEYLQNSNVASSFSTSIVVNDTLWGLVACQNTNPKHIDLYDRQITEVLTRITANAYTSLINNQQLQYSHSFYQTTLELKEEILLEDKIENIENFIDYMKNFVVSDGITFYSPHNQTSSGSIPDPTHIAELAQWALKNLREDIYYSDHFYTDSSFELGPEENSIGVMLLILNRIEGKMVFWFKKESIRTIQWAGMDDKMLEQREIFDEKLLVKTPRKSFEIIREVQRGRSTSWTDKDIAGITILQNLLLETTNEKNSRISELNRILQEKNDELDTFSYTVSHDLRSPLTVMGLTAQQLMNKITDASQKEKVKEIMVQVEDLTAMMNDILNLSRVNKSEIELIKLQPESIINRCIQESMANFSLGNTNISTQNFPEILADKTMAYQVISNIIGNAVKYSSKKENPKVEIWAEELPESVVYFVKDNGIGISQEYREKMFQLFSRQPNALEFKGSGVGLSIVKRLMERMGGEIDFDSEPNVGSTFRITFQKPVHD
ncbi:MAG: ATP-binding protein [Flavobacteriaceae bacterium]|nr:ATP-binding protein [Flavobacteriaceae bacterium]